MDHDNDPADEPAPRRRRFKEGNVGPDGEYIVGKGKPPKYGRFAVGDGRRRGRRPKGQRNFDSEFEEEAQRRITIRENGKERRVSKMRSAIIRAFDNAGAKGQNQAIATVFQQGMRIADRVAPTSQGLNPDEDATINDWIARRLASLGSGDQPGDPDEPPGEAVAAEQEDNCAPDHDDE